MTADTQSGNETVVATVGDREIHTERIFDAPRERVWEAFTNPDQISQWWGSRETTTVIDTLEFEPGGAWRFVSRDRDGAEHAFRGTFREIAPPERVVQTFEWEGMPGHIAVETMTLEDLGDGRTKLSGTSLFHTGEERDGMVSSGMEHGLKESYQRLDELLAKG